MERATGVGEPAPRTPFEQKSSEGKPSGPQDFPKAFDKGKAASLPPLPKEPDPDFESPVVLQDDLFLHNEMGNRSAFGPLIVLTTKQPYDRKKMLRALVLPSRDEGDGHARRPHDASVLFLSDRSFMLGAPTALIRYAELQGRDTRRPLCMWGRIR